MRSAAAPLAVDVGYGASHTTTVEWAGWLRQIRPDIEVVGLEDQPGARPAASRSRTCGARCARGLPPGGLFVEGTCDELGRRCAWLLLDASGPRTLTLSWSPFHTSNPSEVAERLPKALIHRNVPGEPIHQFLADADAAWERAGGWDPHGPRVRWRHALEDLARDWPVHPQRRRLADNFVTVDWQAVAPAS